jgi:hypothetical protein
MSLYTADLVTSGLSDVGYQQIADDKSEVVARTQTGVTEIGSTGIYAVNAPTLGATTAALVWTSTGTASARAVGDVVDRDVDAILVDTAEIGAAGAGLTEAGGDGDHLTAINLPNQTMDITGNITGNLSGTVGSVTGAVGSVTGAVGSVAGNVDGNVSGTCADLLAISGSTAAADKLQASAETIVIGAAEAGTLSTTQMTSDLAEATDDHFNGRVIIWTSGVLIQQASDITDYSGATGLLTFTAVTEAPSAADTFVIV